MLLSIGEIVDKLVIENIKIALLKEKMREGEEVYPKMMVLNANRSAIVAALNEKIELVISGKEDNQILKTVKTWR